MELKTYQKKVISDLSTYMQLLNQTGKIDQAYRLFWNQKGLPVESGKIPPYQNILQGVPHLCLKVPTGGGKTFIACNAIRPIFDGLPNTKTKAVVWLVPSESIMTQTLAALKNSEHPYRQRINTDFNSRVEVYTKEELLNGQNFNITSISEQLSIMVLSYDSFRGRKESLKAKQENSNLAPIAKALGAPVNPIADVDETALMQVINQLNPVVIVDESHHARSNLSKDMLTNFNPSFVLDLTATPTKDSNVLCYVDAIQLKRENMVKLPVIVYNRDSMQEVIVDAIDLRNRLEQQAQDEYLQTGNYVRPIVLFQAQPRGKEDSATFDRLREKLISVGIPADQIAIKTADINEIKNVDLLSEDCKIRYIITVNALKEGWDCPFAYILASLANKTSQIDVEQILGRVLRQPYTRRFRKNPTLNMSYVLTSSNDFKNTLDKIVRGLNSAGFSEKDYRVGEIDNSESPKEEITPAGTQTTLFPEKSSEQISDSTAESTESEKGLSDENAEDFLNFDGSYISVALQERNQNSALHEKSISGLYGADALLQDAARQQEDFEKTLEDQKDDPFSDIPEDVKDNMNTFKVNPEFEEELRSLKLPQFAMHVEQSIFVDGYNVRLERENLAEGFSLKGKPYDIDFERADDEIAKIDLKDSDGSTPRVFKMSEADQRFFVNQFSQWSEESKIQECKDILFRAVRKIDSVGDSDLRKYVDIVVDMMDEQTLKGLQKSPVGYAERLKKYVQRLMDSYYEETFQRWIEIGKITVEPYYEFPSIIAPLQSTTMYGGSLYEGEEAVNGFEYDMVMELTAMGNIRWWHRNPSRTGFRINGFINHYPDFIVETKSGKIILIETKGDHLENSETKQKIRLGRAWQNLAGPKYRYYMVFQDKDLHIEGAYPMDEFVEMLKKM